MTGYDKLITLVKDVLVEELKNSNSFLIQRANHIIAKRGDKYVSKYSNIDIFVDNTKEKITEKEIEEKIKKSNKFNIYNRDEKYGIEFRVLEQQVDFKNGIKIRTLYSLDFEVVIVKLNDYKIKYHPSVLESENYLVLEDKHSGINEVIFLSDHIEKFKELNVKLINNLIRLDINERIELLFNIIYKVSIKEEEK